MMGERQPLLSVVRYYIRSCHGFSFLSQHYICLSAKLGLEKYFSRALQRRGGVKTHLIVDITAEMIKYFKILTPQHCGLWS